MTIDDPSISDYIFWMGSNVLRCLGVLSFALENYPTLCIYRRGAS